MNKTEIVKKFKKAKKRKRTTKKRPSIQKLGFKKKTIRKRI